MCGLELWAGPECTVNRVGNAYFDQLEISGHARRVEDLDLFAGLGVRTLRYPVLWERMAPDSPQCIDWTWADERLGRLKELGIEPIVGLVHHGSGPRYTSLADEGFADGLARYARAVAARYPWVRRFTPVNEPLTTARFSALYGLWYPHWRNAPAFARLLLNECRAVVLAMRAIREVNPEGELLQTEDAARTFSTPELAYQAEHENSRRWLTFDLLSGRVGRHHPMWHYMRWLGVPAEELEWFVENPCPPDIIGLNYYLTSERFLDQRVELYPADRIGGNGRQVFADVEAVRVREEGIEGFAGALREAWDRYRRPLALTEVQNACTREEQARWLLEAWNAAGRARADGVDVRAVTAWSLLGAYDWNTLLTQAAGCYECGVFDLVAQRPRATLVAEVLRDLAAGRRPDHPALEEPGWWRRPFRLIFGFSVNAQGELKPVGGEQRTEWTPAGSRPILITGATGTLGRAFARVCRERGIVFHLLGRNEMDIADGASVRAALERHRPWAVVNGAGYVRVDDAEQDAGRCFRENTTGPAVLAEECARRGIRLLTYSSDLVFDGGLRRPYVESDAVGPLCVYGSTKAQAERLVLEAMPSALVVRTSAFFGPWDEHNFVIAALRALASQRTFSAACDSVVSPTYVPDLIHRSLDLVLDGEDGIRHLSNSGAVSWAELAREAAQKAGLEPGEVQACAGAALGLKAKRPAFSVLSSERGEMLPALGDALDRFLHDCEIRWQPAT